jgi:2'-5' RNA ligase
MLASIWLQPMGAARQKLKALIAELAAEHGTVPFDPHLTVCGTRGLGAAQSAAAADYISRCRPLPFRVRKLGVSYSTTTSFKSVVTDVENTPQLRQFREELRWIIGAAEPEPPHISLLYTIDGRAERTTWAADGAKLSALAAAAAARVEDAEFVLGDPIIVTPEGDWTNIRSWKILRKL